MLGGWASARRMCVVRGDAIHWPRHSPFSVAELSSSVQLSRVALPPVIYTAPPLLALLRARRESATKREPADMKTAAPALSFACKPMKLLLSTVTSPPAKRIPDPRKAPSARTCAVPASNAEFVIVSRGDSGWEGGSEATQTRPRSERPSRMSCGAPSFISTRQWPSLGHKKTPRPCAPDESVAFASNCRRPAPAPPPCPVESSGTSPPLAAIVTVPEAAV